jgi:Zinc finger, C3HC4 type (RING finger)
MHKSMGKREPSDSHSMASASSHRSDPGRKPARFFSLRRMIQDMQQQRITSSRKRRSNPADADPRSSSAAAASSTDAVGWHTSSRQTVDDATGGTAAATSLDEEAEIGIARGGDPVDDVDCPLCALKAPVKDLIRVTASCSHRVCSDCLRHYLSIEIMESRVNVECPACPEKLHPNDIRRILGKNARELISKYEEFTLRRLLVHDPDARWCPAPDCGYVLRAALQNKLRPFAGSFHRIAHVLDQMLFLSGHLFDQTLIHVVWRARRPAIISKIMVGQFYFFTYELVSLLLNTPWKCLPQADCFILRLRYPLKQCDALLPTESLKALNMNVFLLSIRSFAITRGNNSF